MPTRRRSRRPPEALAAIRRTITLGADEGFDDGLRLERELPVELAGTENLDEGVSATLEERPPVWRR